MLTNREFYSAVINDLRAVNIDSWLSPVFVLDKGRAVFGDFIKKSNDVEQSLYKVSEVWFEIDCLPLIEVPVSQCDIGINSCKKLMKTVDAIPDTFDSRYGNLIRNVSSVNFSNFYEPTTPKGYKDIQKRKDQSKTNYYFFLNNHIYIPVKEITAPEIIRISLIPLKSWGVIELNAKNNSCTDCKQECLKRLDTPFVCSESLLNAVKKETVLQIAQIYSKMVPDTYSNNDNNQRQPPQQ
jgi:hypothetical protein